MRDAIIRKLESYLAIAPSSEADVVYVLVEIRKILEHDEQAGIFSTLSFYCDWAVHVKLDRRGARQILQLLDDRLGHFDPANPGSLDRDGKALDVLSFGLLREHLHRFCESKGLPTVWTEDEAPWQKFLLLYAEVVRDSPLVMNRRDYEFDYLRRLVIRVGEPPKAMVEASSNLKLFALDWEFTLSDGRTFKMPYTCNYLE